MFCSHFCSFLTSGYLAAVRKLDVLLFDVPAIKMYAFPNFHSNIFSLKNLHKNTSSFTKSKKCDKILSLENPTFAEKLCQGS